MCTSGRQQQQDHVTFGVRDYRLCRDAEQRTSDGDAAGSCNAQIEPITHAGASTVALSAYLLTYFDSTAVMSPPAGLTENDGPSELLDVKL